MTRALLVSLVLALAVMPVPAEPVSKDVYKVMGLQAKDVLLGPILTSRVLPGASSDWLPPQGSFTPDSLWNTIVAEIDAGRPLMGFQPGHAVVIRGYQLNPGLNPGRRILFINDPWIGRYRIDFSVALQEEPRRVPRAGEKGVACVAWKSDRARETVDAACAGLQIEHDAHAWLLLDTLHQRQHVT